MYTAKIKSIPLEDAYNLRKQGNKAYWVTYGNLLGIKHERLLTIMKLTVLFRDDDRMRIIIEYIYLNGGSVSTSEKQTYSLTELKMKYPKLFNRNGKMIFSVS